MKNKPTKEDEINIKLDMILKILNDQFIKTPTLPVCTCGATSTLGCPLHKGWYNITTS
jgi:hypothetical protein